MQASLITPRYGACAVIFSNHLVVVGGQRTEMTGDNAVEVYSVKRTKWKQLKIFLYFASKITIEWMINREETEPLAKKVYYPQIKIKHAVRFGRLVLYYCNII